MPCPVHLNLCTPGCSRQRVDWAASARHIGGLGARALVLLLAMSPAWAAAPVNPAPKPLGCLIEPDRVINVGSPLITVVQRVAVNRGDAVAAGQLLLTLRADVEQANVGAAQVRAGIDAESLAAKAGVELARSELEVARQKLNQVLGQQNIWLQERHVAEAQLALRTVNSPVAGVVIERFVEPGSH